jgi:hypothetical protein
MDSHKDRSKNRPLTLFYALYNPTSPLNPPKNVFTTSIQKLTNFVTFAGEGQEEDEEKIPQCPLKRERKGERKGEEPYEHRGLLAPVYLCVQ